MRKYKDVGKRILVMVLAVCMFVTLLPQMPAWAADNFPSNGVITLGRDANGAVSSGSDTYVYTGQEIKPEVQVQIDSVTLTEGRDYYVSYRSNVNAGTAYIDITGLTDAYNWSCTRSFTIAQQELDYIGVSYQGVEGNGSDSYVYYTGSDVLPTITNVFGLISGTGTQVALSSSDYTVSYTAGNNTSVGTHSFRVVLSSNSNYRYAGSVQDRSYNIYYNLGSDTVRIGTGLNDVTYSGSPQCPAYTLTDSQNSSGILESDYTASWSNNTNVGSATLKVTANSGSMYRGSKTFNFNINQADLGGQGFSVSMESDKYYYVMGSRPDMTGQLLVELNGVTIPSSNYIVSYLNANAGAVGLNTLLITGTNNLSGSTTTRFYIYDRLGSVNLDKTELEYNGRTNVPVITVKNTSGETVLDSNYTVTYYSDAAYTQTVAEPRAIGRYYVKVAGKGYFEGELGTPSDPIIFDIVAKSLDKCVFTLSVSGVEIGVIDRNSNYSGFYDTSNKVLSLSAVDDEGNNLIRGTDFTYAVYTDEACTNRADDDPDTADIQELRNAGTYYIKVTGAEGGNYAGSERVFTYTIKPKTVSPSYIIISPQTYTGAAVVPDPANITVQYLEGGVLKSISSDCIEVVSCTNNVQIGDYTATATIRLTGNYTLDANGIDTGEFSIVPRKLSQCDCNLVSSSSNYDPSQTDFEYNGQKQVPQIRITDNNGTRGLQEGVDFRVTYFTDSTYQNVIAEPVDAGTYFVLISGMGIYANTDADASIRTSYTIHEKNISTLLASATNMAYTGSAVEPAITLTDGARTLELGTDYEVEGYYADDACTVVSDHTASGRVYVRLEALPDSNYSGTIVTSFYIGTNIATLVDAFNVSGGTYNRDSHKNEITAAIESKLAEAAMDGSSYTITFYADAERQNVITSESDSHFVEAGNVYYRVSGAGAYYGQINGTAVINKKDIAELQATVIGEHVYNGLEQTVAISTSLDVDGVILQYPTTNGYILTADEYSIVSSQDATNAGMATLTLRARDDSNYTGTTTATYRIAPRDLNDLAQLRVNVASAVYSNKVLSPTLTVSYGDTQRTLRAGVDYQIQLYTDEEFTTLASAADMTNAGTTYVRIQGIGNYEGVLLSADFDAGTIIGSNRFVIEPRSIETVGVSLEGKDYLFSNNIPEFVVTQEFPNESGSGSYAYELKPGVDYTYTPTGVDKFVVGRQNITINGQGNFKGTKNSYFYYDGKMDNSAGQVEVNLSYNTVAYDAALAAGDGMKPTVTVYVKGADPQVRLTEGVDYTVTYQNNKVPGQASVVITGIEKNHWVGSYVAHFDITGSITDASITIPAQRYTGSPYSAAGQPIQNMQVVCDGKTLVLGTDYQIKSIVNATDVSMTDPTVTIEGIGAYFSGEKSATFAIKYDISSVNLAIDLDSDIYSYTGSAITPTPSVKYYLTGNTYDTLTEGVDYTVTYRNNTAVAAANGENGPCVVIQATANGRLMGSTRSKAFTIDSIHMEDYEIVGVNDSYTYTGKLIRPQTLMIRKKGGSEIIDPANYDVFYQTNAENPSTAPAGSVETITVIGKGNYDGTLTKNISITPRNINDTTHVIEDQTYNGEELKPEVKFTFNDENGQEQTLSLGTDYIVEEYCNNVNAAASNGANAPYATVRGVNSCTGSIIVPFTILKKDVADLVYSDVTDPQYVPLKVKYEPEVQVYMSSISSEPLEQDVAYTVQYFNNTAVLAANGTSGPFIQITPKDTTNYTGTHTIPFSILPKDISEDEISATLSDSSDTGFDPSNRNYPYKPNTTYTPLVSLRDSSENGIVALVNGTDYIYEYSSNNNQVGTAWVTVTGRGNYTGTRIEKFTIGTLLSPSTVTVSGISDTVYNGLDTTPENIQVKFNQTGEYLTPNDDYIVKYYTDPECLTEASAIDLIHAGTVYVAIIGSENILTGYVGTVVIPYEIARKSLTSADIEISGNDNMNYTGGALTPDLTLRDTSTGLLIDSSQYTVTYENNVEIGTASATITATESGNYKDSITAYYKITKHDIGGVVAEAIPDQMYTGDYIRPEMTIYDNGKLLVEGVDYEVTNGNNIRAGESWVIIKGLGNYDQTKRVYFNIVASLETAIIDDIEEQIYTGNPVTPPVKVACGGNTLVLNQDYTVVYANNTTVGDASITIRPLTSYYTGTIVKKFQITNRINSATVSGVPATVTYTGQAYTPEVTVVMGGKTLTRDVDYTVSYRNNVRVGTATVVITGMGIYSGEKTVTFRIQEKSINNCTIYAVASQTYNGKLQTPPVVVKDGNTALVQGRDYTLSYRNNLNVGTGYVTITGAGDYKGSATKSFAIVQPKAVTNVLIQNKNSAAGTFDVLIDGVAGYVNNVQVPVWTKTDQSDIVWYNATRVDADTFIVHVNMSNHKNNVGVYNIHVYTSGTNNPLQCSYTTHTTFGNGYENVFDYDYYMTYQKDVARAYNGNTEYMFSHFVQYGMSEGRQAIATFNVQSYRAKYRDLRAAYGSDLRSYYMHYMNYGKAEGRTATGSTAYVNALTVYNGVDYSLVYDYNFYVNKYPDIKAAFNGDEEATLRHFVQYGMNEGRQAKASFSVGVYKKNYADLRSAYGNNLSSYYMHYISYGYREKRTAI